MKKPKRAVFTIAAANYFNKAMAALESARAFDPESSYLLALCERPDVVERLPAPKWLAVRTIFEMGMPDPERSAFKYDILELATSVKPFVFRELFAEGAESATYIDPDVRLYRRLYSVNDYGSDAVVTPHLTEDRPDGCFPTVHHMLKGGQFNFGYLSLRNTRNASDFLAWWAVTLLDHCVKDHANGIFVDQSWGAAIVSLMDGVHVERAPGSHAAYWNLRHGDLTGASGKYFVRGEPLTMFHFSGFDPLNPVRLSCHSERFNPLPPGSVLRDLALEHAADIKKRCAALPADSIPYSFDRFEGGGRVSMADRRSLLFHSGELRASPFKGSPGLPAPRAAGFREAYVRRTWQLLGRMGPGGGPSRVVLYGAGKHLDWLAHTVAGTYPAPRVLAVMDDKAPSARGHFGFERVLTPDMVAATRPASGKADPALVLLCTDVPANAEAMAARVKSALGPDVPVRYLYEGCPPGQYY